MQGTATEFDFGPGLRLEEQIDVAEGEAVETRWEFGRWMLTHVSKGQKKLPDGFLDGLCERTRKSRAELQFRRTFAERFPTREALSNALDNHPSWHEIVNKALASTAHLSAEKDEWATPQDLFDELDAEFGFDLDVCASNGNAKCKDHFTAEDDGLGQEWTGTCWMNPPYSEVEDWMAKARAAGENGAIVVCLVPSRTDVGWFWDYARHGEVRFLRGRLHFVDNEENTGPAPFPSALVVFGHKPKVVWYDR